MNRIGLYRVGSQYVIFLNKNLNLSFLNYEDGYIPWTHRGLRGDTRELLV